MPHACSEHKLEGDPSLGRVPPLFPDADSVMKPAGTIHTLRNLYTACG
jgi:hypothetical protein